MHTSITSLCAGTALSGGGGGGGVAVSHLMLQNNPVAKMIIHLYLINTFYYKLNML